MTHDDQLDGLGDVADVVERARRAAPGFTNVGREPRARLLETMAGHLEGARADLVTTAAAETALDPDVLDAEVTRTADQLRMFAGVVREGSYLEATVDTAPGGDVMRWLRPLGPVAVFGASNFPFAYGVAGGDTASALAAGCPVVAKEHPSHPRTCRAVLSALRAAAAAAGVSPDVIGMVSGFEAGAQLVTHPDITAVGFTGSVGGGRALFDLCAARPLPIPFYGELGSVNPAVVLPHAARSPERVIEPLVTSMLARGGQVCTKAGLVFLPDDAEDLADRLRQRMLDAPRPVLLNPSITAAYAAGTARRAALDGVEVLSGDAAATGAGDRSPVSPVLLATTVVSLLDDANADLRDECFGPYAVLVRYRSVAELRTALAALPSSLVAGVYATDGDLPDARDVLPVLVDRAGRVVWNQPTSGLRVGWATHHGGGYPASTASGTTSVGATAIRRWLRPSALQGWPAALLPAELRDAAGGDDRGLPVRRNGRLNGPLTAREVS
ncbi:aldehyde dehydrogenase family protein [Micromonospora peucetia]|uniref:NADP-dependent aldehyde dehydrogenase n=1 Tax=Micromonospora peucetia TaxID=47871 RepID=A0A1C6W4Z8_9ACTN|nr:aldehyde dehydrogenase family protein [Micromonospora peucetia]MCX4390103.1 aldehyde dehydrogenase family protein [Micromonospora peucetia]SCL73454.1 NADP-dependent aldehyde dehydrogenase [Micromonospora peucetia]